MKITEIDYSATGAFSALITDYLARDPKLAAFYHRYPELAAFGEQLKEKQFNPEHRAVLCQELARQYSTLATVHPAVQQNLDLLAQPNTYTVTTGHQLNIFTGPLYFVYKIITTINLARQLQEAYPAYNFVPVYWMATEDHDFAEINHFNLFGKLYTWESEQKGAVGRFNLHDMEALLASLPAIDPVLTKPYRQQQNLADATRALTQAHFGEYGLVALDGDNPALKQLFAPVIQRELREQIAHEQVSQASEKLAVDYKAQVISREINLFYLDQRLRERIVLEENRYKILNTDLSFSLDEIEKLAAEHPERFSPNVILRPLYQEMVLPNLAYIGGGAEVNYWGQLKSLFETFQVTFPMVLLRNSALYITKPNATRLQKLNLAVADIFKDTAALKKQITAQFEQKAISLAAEKDQVKTIFDQIEKLAAAVDGTLTKTVAAEAQKVQNALEVLEKKLVKANDAKYEIYFNQLANLKDKLFPGGTLQERVDNLLTYAINNPNFIPELVAAFQPLDFRFTILEEE